MDNVESLLDKGLNVGLWGAPGIGKSSIVQQFCTEHPLKYHSVFWAELTDETRPEQILYTWARYARKNYQLGTDQSISARQMADEVRSLLAEFISKHSANSALFVIDNVWQSQVETTQTIIRAIPAGFFYILTTRQNGVVSQLHCQLVELGPLNDAQSELLFDMNITSRYFHQDQRERLKMLLGGNPLALNHAIVTLNQAGSEKDTVSIIDAYQESIESGADITLELEDQFITCPSIFAVLEFSYQNLGEIGQFCFRQLGVLPLNSVWNETLLEPMWQGVKTESMLRSLRLHSLIENQNGYFRQHALLHSHALWHLRNSDEVEQASLRYVDAVARVCENATYSTPESSQRLIPHVQCTGTFLLSHLDRISAILEEEIETELSDLENKFVHFAFWTLEIHNRFHLSHRFQLALTGLLLAEHYDLEAYCGHFALFLADYLVSLGDYAGATTLIARISTKEPYSQIAVKKLQALVEWRRERFSEAITLLDEALRVAQGIRDDYLEQQVSAELSVMLSDPPMDDDIRNLDRAEILIRRSLEFNDANPDWPYRAILLNRLGLIKERQDLPYEAIDFMQQAIVLRDTVGDLHGKAISQNSLALSYGRLKRYKETLPLLESAAEVFRATEDWRNLGHALHNTGWIYLRIGETENAQKFLKEALAYRKNVNDTDGEIRTLQELLGLFIAVSESANASQIYVRIMKLCNRHSWLRDDAVVANLKMGSVEFDKHRLGKALRYYEKAESFLTEDSTLAGGVYLILAYIHFRLNNAPNFSHYNTLYSNITGDSLDFVHESEHVIVAEKLIHVGVSGVTASDRGRVAGMGSM